MQNDSLDDENNEKKEVPAEDEFDFIQLSSIFCLKRTEKP